MMWKNETHFLIDTPFMCWVFFSFEIPFEGYHFTHNRL